MILFIITYLMGLLNVIHARELDDVVAIQNNLVCQFVYVLLDLVMLHHDDHKITCRKERVKFMILIRYDIFGDEGIINFQAGSKVAFLTLKQLKCR